MRRAVVFLAIFAILITSIVGCSPATVQPASTSAPTPTTAEKVTLKVMNWSTDRTDVYNQIGAEFQKTHPNVTIEWVTKDMSQYFTILATMIQSGEAPDLFNTLGIASSNLGELVKQGYVEPLDAYIETSAYPDWITSKFTIDGKRYAIPGMVEDTLGVFYNKKVFDQYGLEPPKSQDEMIKIMDILLENGITPIAFPGKDGMNSYFSFLIFIQAYAPDWNNNFPKNGKTFSDPEFVNATKEFLRWLDKGYMGKDYRSMDNSSAIMALIQGKAGMIFQGGWEAGNYKDVPEINVMFLKRPDGKDAGITSPKQDMSLSVYAKSAHKDLAIEFARFFASKPVQQMIANTNTGVPASFPAAEGISVPDRLLNQFGARDFSDLTYVDTGNIIPMEGQDYFGGSIANTQELVFGRMTPEEYAAANDKLLDYTKLPK